jgi:hypothetical protein
MSRIRSGTGSSSSRRWAAAILVALAVAPRAVRAVDAFEIQVYDGTANAPGKAGVELHLNYVASGVAVTGPPELPAHHQAHFTLEPSYGVLPTWELGAYFLTALRGDGTFDVVGGKLRSKHVTPPGWSRHARLGLNGEVGYSRPTYEADRWGVEVRPIAAWEDERVLLAVNPNIELSLAGGSISFEPAALAVLAIRRVASFGLEYYGDLSERQHYLYEVANLLAIQGLELNVGVGEGLTRASNAVVAKVILGRTF